MIVAEEKAQISGDLVFDEQVQMALDPTAIAMHIRNMIRMYANPRLAALREYTSNARDAHKAAGYTGPVEVTLPTSLHPFLTIKDHGIGLDREEVKGFGQFGRSTKNNDNDYIGGFGLGSKSGLAVATQFTVVAVKNGKKNVVVVGRDEKNNPSLGFMAEQDTTDHDGVTIQIPSEKGHEDWVQIASGNTFMGWEPGSILINGKPQAVSVHDTTLFTPVDGGWLTLTERSRGYNYGQPIHALVHGVYYAIPTDKFQSRNHPTILKGSVLNIDNGSVDILPSRDDLEWTDRTRQAINAAARRLTTSIVEKYKEEIATAKSFMEARIIVDRMEEIDLPTAGLTYNGTPLDWTTETDRVLTVGRVKASASATSGYQTDRTASGTRKERGVHREHSILVLGATGETKAGYYRKDHRYVAESIQCVPFIAAEAKAQGKDTKNVVLYFWNQPDSSGLPVGFVAAMAKVIDVPAFEAQSSAQRKLWAAERAANRKAGATPKPKQVDRQLRTPYRWDSYSNRLHTIERSEQAIITGGKPVVVLHQGDALSARILEAHSSNAHSAGEKAIFKLMVQEQDAGNTAFVLLAKNHKVENLAIKGWTEMSDWLRAEIAKIKTRTPMQINAEQYKQNASYYDSIMKLSAKSIAKIDDRETREWMDAYCNPITDGHVGEIAKAFPSYAGKQPLPSAFSIKDRYPLVTMITARGDNEQEFVDYLNLTDRARSAGLI